MADDMPEKKEEKGGEFINLKVVDADHNEVFFKIKRTTPFSKLMTAYCERNGKSVNDMRFLFEGARLASHQTPADFDMEDDDSIEVHVNQTGGSH